MKEKTINKVAKWIERHDFFVFFLSCFITGLLTVALARYCLPWMWKHVIMLLPWDHIIAFVVAVFVLVLPIVLITMVGCLVILTVVLIVEKCEKHRMKKGLR